MVELINGDCLEVLRDYGGVDCIFADPPDNIGLGYAHTDDRLKSNEYNDLLRAWVAAFLEYADNAVWVSFNSRHVHTMGRIVCEFADRGFLKDWDFQPCVQTFTFGQYNTNDFSNCHRPLWRFTRKGLRLNVDAIRVPSARMLQGDKRASGPRVPGDVFEFSRVVGNSKQRRPWHPTQLNEGLVERCILMTTNEGDHVLDPFGGTGTTARVCQRLNRSCTLVEISPTYCEHIRKDLNID